MHDNLTSAFWLEKNTDYGQMVTISQILKSISQSQIEKPVKWMNILAFCRRNGWVRQNPGLEIQSDEFERIVLIKIPRKVFSRFDQSAKIFEKNSHRESVEKTKNLMHKRSFMSLNQILLILGKKPLRWVSSTLFGDPLSLPVQF